MLGAILGDIIGSQFEWTGSKMHEFPLFSDACTFTDDSVTTLADIAEQLLHVVHRCGSIAMKL